MAALNFLAQGQRNHLTDETDAPHRGHVTVNIATSLRRTIMES